MNERLQSPAEKPALSPRLAALQAEIGRYKHDIHTLVLMTNEAGGNTIDVVIEPPAHLRNVPGDVQWSSVELDLVAGAIRRKYLALGVDLAVTVKAHKVDPEQQIAAILASDSEGEGPVDPSTVAGTSPEMHALSDTDRLPTITTPVPLKGKDEPKFVGVSAAANDLLRILLKKKNK